jgi:hypothetical protein
LINHLAYFNDSAASNFDITAGAIAVMRRPTMRDTREESVANFD